MQQRYEMGAYGALVVPAGTGLDLAAATAAAGQENQKAQATEDPEARERRMREEARTARNRLRRQRRRRKVRALSKLKKRVLADRAAFWGVSYEEKRETLLRQAAEGREALAAAAADATTAAAVPSEAGPSSRVLVVRGYVSMEELETDEEEELEELRADLGVLVQLACGEGASSTDSETVLVQVGLVRASGAGHDGKAEALGVVELAQPEYAAAVVKALNGKVVGGTPLQVRLYAEEAYSSSSWSWEDHSLRAVPSSTTLSATGANAISVATAAATSARSVSRILAVRGYVDADELRELLGTAAAAVAAADGARQGPEEEPDRPDDDEREEELEEMRSDLAALAGLACSSRGERGTSEGESKPPVIVRTDLVLSSTSASASASASASGDESEALGVVEFARAEDAAMAATALDGKVVGGTALEARLYSEDAYASSLWSWSEHAQSCTNEDGFLAGRHRETSLPSRILAVRGYVDVDELRELLLGTAAAAVAAADGARQGPEEEPDRPDDDEREEELEEMRSDLAALAGLACSSRGERGTSEGESKPPVIVRTDLVLSSTSASASASALASGDESEALGVVEFARAEDAAMAATALDGKVVGGTALEARLYSEDAYASSLWSWSEHSLLPGTSSLFDCAGPTSTVGGAPAAVAAATAAEEEEKHAKQDAYQAEEPRRQPLVAQALGDLDRIPDNVQPQGDMSILCPTVTDPDMEQVVVSMLRELVARHKRRRSEQRRAEQRAGSAGPQSSSSNKKVLISGLREILRAVRSGAAQMVILSRDIENSTSEGSLQDRVHEINRVALDRDIPVVQALSKRKLAKLLQLKVKQSAVAVCDFEGAHSQKKTLLRWMSTQH